MRWKIRCDCTAEPPGELIASATAAALGEGAFHGPGDRREGQPGTQRRREADDPGEPDHGDDGSPGAKATGQDRRQKLPDPIERQTMGHGEDRPRPPAQVCLRQDWFLP
jgi:hypothetical protein